MSPVFSVKYLLMYSIISSILKSMSLVRPSCTVLPLMSRWNCRACTSLNFSTLTHSPIAADGVMHAYKHKGFWKPMDMLKDNMELEKMWATDQAPWKVW